MFMTPIPRLLHMQQMNVWALNIQVIACLKRDKWTACKHQQGGKVKGNNSCTCNKSAFMLQSVDRPKAKMLVHICGCQYRSKPTVWSVLHTPGVWQQQSIQSLLDCFLFRQCGRVPAILSACCPTQSYLKCESTHTKFHIKPNNIVLDDLHCHLQTFSFTYIMKLPSSRLLF